MGNRWKRWNVPQAHSVRIIEYLGISYRSEERVCLSLVRECVPNEGRHTLTDARTEIGLNRWNYSRGFCIHLTVRRSQSRAPHNAPSFCATQRKSFYSFKSRQNPRIDTIHGRISKAGTVVTVKNIIRLQCAC